MATTSATNVAYTPGGTPIPIVDADKTGFNAMTAESFLKLLVVQLQNQDPTAPMSNEELLNQISGMRDLQASTELQTTLKDLANSQSSSSQTQLAASLIGKKLTAKLADGTTVSGVASSAVIEGGKAYVRINALKVPVDNITSIEAE